MSAAGRHATARGDDRLGSFVHEHGPARLDLRSAALPAVPLVREMLAGQFAEDFAETLNTHGYVPAGLPTLRSAIASYYDKLGLPTNPMQILVTSGAQQAIRLVAQALIEPGDAVLIEEPTYRGAIEVMRSAGARLYGVRSGAEGIDSVAVADAVKRHKPRLLIIQSIVHNPTGSVLGEQARVTLAKLSAELGLTVVDHLPGMDTLIEDAIPRPLAAYGGDILTIGSASKAFWGGLRVGWIRADADIIGHFTTVKSAEDLGTSIPSQAITARLLSRVDEARAYRRSTLGHARDLMLKALSERLPHWRPIRPRGGASIWIELPKGYSGSALAERAGRAGVDVLPGPTFSSENALDNSVRVAFAAPMDVLLAAVDRLHHVWHKEKAVLLDRSTRSGHHHC